MYLFFCGRTDSDSFSLCKHVRVFVWLSLVCVLSTTANRLAKKREFTGVTNQPITTRQDSFCVTLITSAFPLCSLYLCVSVYRVFPHLESGLCFPLRPFPCSENSFPPPCSSRPQPPFLPPPPLSKPPFPVRSRQKLGLPFSAVRELASNLLFL